MCLREKRKVKMWDRPLRLCEEWGIAVAGLVISLWGDRLGCFCSVLHPRENPHEVPGIARVELGSLSG